MKIEIAIGIDGTWVVMSHPPRNEENDSTITALFEQHQYDARIGETFELPPGIYQADVVWKCDGDPADPTNDGHYVEVQPQAAAHGMAQSDESFADWFSRTEETYCKADCDEGTVPCETGRDGWCDGVSYDCDGQPDGPCDDCNGAQRLPCPNCASLRLVRFAEYEAHLRHRAAQVAEALRGLLLHGQHEGECEYYDDDPDNACRLHVEASRAREAAARQALAALDTKGESSDENSRTGCQ